MAFDTNVYDFQFNSNNSPNETENTFSGIDDFNIDSSINQKEDCNMICAMCHRKIKDCGLYSLNHDLIFCDLVCAKIYSDNINKIDIDFQTYRNNYVSKKFSVSAEKIYQKYKYKFFQQLPILIIKDDDKNKLNQYLIENRMKDYRLLFKEIKSMF